MRELKTDHGSHLDRRNTITESFYSGPSTPLRRARAKKQKCIGTGLETAKDSERRTLSTF